MVDLENKIQELLKALFSLKEQQGFFVPSIKSPQLKSPSPVGGTSSPFKVSAPKAPSKIPGGLPPPSQKDPVKMAQQLKNPRPTAPPVEVLKVEENGQWSLSKADDLGTAKTFVPAAVTRNIRPPKPVVTPGPGPTASTAISSPKALGRIGASGTQRSTQGAPQVLSAQQHGWTHLHSPEQNRLIEGLQLHNRQYVGKGSSGAAFAPNSNHSDLALVKDSTDHPDREIRGHVRNNFNSAKREVLYHDLAHKFFGLGQHVPTTAGFTHEGKDWSAQKKINNASPVMYTANENRDLVDVDNPHHHRVLQNLNNNGTLDKLAIMDHLTGHHDRHGDNFLVDDAPNPNSAGLHLIDNGTAFDYGNLDSNPIPHYRSATQALNLHGPGGHESFASFHPEAKKWLQNLNPEDAKKILAAHGHDESSPAYRGFMNRLQGLKAKVARPITNMLGTNGVLEQNRLDTDQDPQEYT